MSIATRCAFATASLALTSFCRFIANSPASGLDEVQPEVIANAIVYDRYRFVADTGRPTWRRGPIYWERDLTQRTTENCIVPLAADGMTVDKIFAVSVVFDANGREI